MDKLYQLKEMLCEELEKYADRELTGTTMKSIDTLAHAIKNICKVIEAAEEEEYSGASYRGSSMRGSSRESGAYAERGSYEGGSSRRGSYAQAGGSYEGGSSYARGRGRGARRDSMGRYSRDEEMVAQLRELYNMANDEMQRDSIKKIIQMAESM